MKKNYKTYNIQNINFIKKSISGKNNITYWANLFGIFKRIAKEYFFELKKNGIKIVSTIINTEKKIKCLGLTKKNNECSRLVSINKRYCFQHLKTTNRNNTISAPNYNLTKKFTFINFFAGCGGITTGFIKAGIKPLYVLDEDNNCCSTLKANHSQVKIVCDSLRMATDNSKYCNKVDILIGGTPCQSFSSIGLKKGLLDKRGKSLLTFINWIFSIRPKIFIIENVRGLLSHDKGTTLKYIIKLLKKDNMYHIETSLINMVNYGIPQKRVRLLIIGTLKVLNISILPITTSSKKLILKDVLKNVPLSDGVKYPLKKKKLFEQIPPGGCWVDLPISLQKDYLGKSFYSGGGQRGILRRLSMNEPSLTLLCSPSQKQTERCHPLENRPLTIKEYARIQTFKDDYIFKGNISSQYRQIGNAVPPKFSYKLGLHLIKKLKVSHNNKRAFSTINYKLDWYRKCLIILKAHANIEQAWNMNGKRNQVNDCLMLRFSNEERMLYLNIHRASMNHGNIWHNIFTVDTTYYKINKLDLQSDVKKTFIELKNKSTTMNYDSRNEVLRKLSQFKKQNLNYICILGIINSPTPIKKSIWISGMEIQILSSDFLFEFIWGEDWELKKKAIIDYWANL